MSRHYHIVLFILWITSTFAQLQTDTLYRLNLTKIATLAKANFKPFNHEKN